MQVASLENCKRLYELSCWKWPEFVWYKADLMDNIWEVNNNSHQKGANVWPAYDLGYLLRKMPEGTTVRRNKAEPRKRSNYHGEWSVGLYRNVKLAEGQQADNPEDALCLMVIHLFEQGVLIKQEGGES